MAENGNGTVRNVLGWVAVLIAGLIITISGVMYSNKSSQDTTLLDKVNAHEARITKTETCLEYMKSDISEIKELTKEIRRDQIRRERQGR